MEPEELPKEIGETVRRLRAARGFSQEGFAQAVGLNRAYYGGIESARFAGRRSQTRRYLLRVGPRKLRQR